MPGWRLYGGGRRPNRLGVFGCGGSGRRRGSGLCAGCAFVVSQRRVDGYGLVFSDHNARDDARFLGLESLHYLSLEGMVAATGMPADQFCLSCYTGNYPIVPPESLEKLCFEKQGK